MKKNKTYYQCQECGYKTPNWMGRCTNCGSWNSFREVNDGESMSKKSINQSSIPAPNPITEVKTAEKIRLPVGINELDRVLGGGIVNGSLVLIGGAPGIGKSTLILQVAFLFSRMYGPVLYVSGEESERQLKLRAGRLEALNDELYVYGETEFEQIQQLLLQKKKYRLVIIDSIQTVYDGRIDSAPGSITQVKEITNQLLRIAKSRGITIVLIGHVTKEGYLAGPRVMEHLVDTVLQFEGDSNYRYRILRAIKNRFGATNEVGLFEMQDKGMVEIANASGIFLEERPKNAAGSVIVPVIEGSRTILVEVQALISRAAFGNPQRLATGISKKRVSILLAVLEKKAGFDFQNLDAHLNIVGGLKIDEPALDLGLIVAMISSYRNQVISSGLAVVGEVGLAGEVRAVERIEERLSELKKLGFKEAIIPRYNMEKIDNYSNIEIQGVENIGEVIDLIFQ